MEPVVIILLLTLLLGLAVVWQLFRERRKKSGQLALALAYERMAMKHKLQIDHVEVFNNRIIALDRKHKKLLFLHHDAAAHQHELISLEAITSFQLVEEREEKFGFIRRVYLALAPADLSMSYLLCFYDHGKDAATELLPAMRRARHWKQRVAAHRNPGMINVETAFEY